MVQISTKVYWEHKLKSQYTSYCTINIFIRIYVSLNVIHQAMIIKPRKCRYSYITCTNGIYKSFDALQAKASKHLKQSHRQSSSHAIIIQVTQCLHKVAHRRRRHSRNDHIRSSSKRKHFIYKSQTPKNSMTLLYYWKWVDL